MKDVSCSAGVAVLALGLLLSAQPAWGQNYNSYGGESGEWDSHHIEGQGYVSVSGSLLYPLESESQDLGVENEIDFDMGWGANVALGTYTTPLRWELELGWRSFEVDGGSIGGISATTADGDINVLTVMGNVYYDFEINDRTDLYVGGGIGVARIEGELNFSLGGLDASFTDDDDWVFAYQVLAGIGYEITPRIMLTTGYRGMSTTNPEFETGEYDSPWIHSVEAGIRFAF